MAGGGATMLVLSEDSSPDGAPTVGTLVSRMLAHLGCETHLLQFRSIAEPAAVEVVGGNRWQGLKNARVESTLRRVCAEVAGVLRSPNGFVAWHVDADHAWGDGSESLNERRLREVIEQRVRRIVADEDDVPDLRRRRARKPAAAELTSRPAERRDHEELMAKFVRLVPSYSIESWLYQNTSRAVALCREHHRGEHVAKLEAWADDRSRLDEVERPKDTTCLSDKHNLDLARSAFPVASVVGQSPSFSRAVERLSTCLPLVEALRPDYAAPVTE